MIASGKRRRPILAVRQQGAAASRRAMPPPMPADGVDPGRALLPGAWHRLDAEKAPPEGLRPSGMGDRAWVRAS
jgi:hypothetical protein